MRVKTMNLDIKKECNNVMVIVPHQDDEILMSAGVIRVCEQNNVPYTVVMVTNGDYGCIDYSKGYARLKESLAGLETLGSNKESFEIMGYADTGMPERESFLTHLYNEKNEQKIYPSSCARETYGLEDKVEFHMKKYGKHGDYNRITFEKDLEMLLEGKETGCYFYNIRI
ncbi:MAG: PIG-L family deacetylase [Roseburia faecis]